MTNNNSYHRTNASVNLLSGGYKMYPNFLLKIGIAVKPTFKGAKTPSVFRPLPGIHPDQPGEFDISLLDDGTPGEWLRSFACVQYAFGKGVSFVLQNGPEDESWAFNSPYMIARNSLVELARNPTTPMYVANLTSGNSMDKPFPEQAVQTIMPALTYRRADKDYQPSVDTPEYLLIGKGPSLMLTKILAEQWSIQHPDYAIDPTDPEKGCFIVIWNKEEILTPEDIDPRLVKTQKGNFGYGIGIATQFPRIGSMYDGIGPQMDQQMTAAYKATMKPWSSVIDYRSYDDQAAIMCDYAPAGPLVYAWGERYPDWLTKEVRVRANNEPRIGGPAPVQGYAVQQPRYGAASGQYDNQPAQNQYQSMYQSPYQEPMQPIRPVQPSQPARPSQPVKQASRPVAPVQADDDEAPWGGPELPIKTSFGGDIIPPKTARGRAVVAAMSAMSKKPESENPME